MMIYGENRVARYNCVLGHTPLWVGVYVCPYIVLVKLRSDYRVVDNKAILMNSPAVHCHSRVSSSNQQWVTSQSQTSHIETRRKMERDWSVY